jgi:hypothetical protein
MLDLHLRGKIVNSSSKGVNKVRSSSFSIKRSIRVSYLGRKRIDGDASCMSKTKCSSIALRNTRKSPEQIAKLVKNIFL